MELVNFSCKWPCSQLDPPLVASLRRLHVNHSMASYVIRYDRKWVASHSWIFLSRANWQVTRGGCTQVVGRSLIGCKTSQVSQRSVANVSRRSGRGCDFGVRVYANRLMNGMRGSQARRSVMVRLQVTLITWPIIHLLFTCMSVTPQHRCKH